jgi:SAM-dependent methyltransferase
MLDIEILETGLGDGFGLAALSAKDLVASACPVCGSAESSRPLTVVEDGGIPTLESMFCSRCEHRYFGRGPSPSWIQNYYTSEWDTGRLAPGGMRAKVRGALKKVPLAAATKRLVARKFGGHVEFRAMQLMPMLFGVISGDGEHYAARKDVKKVLEVGCGAGGTMQEVRRLGLSVTGTEASPARVARCREQGLDVYECPVDSFAPVKGKAPFDLAYSTHVLEHVMDPGAHLREVAGLLRQDGYLYVQVPHVAHGEVLVVQAHYPGHCQGFTVRSLCLLIESCGFSVVRFQVDDNVHVLARRRGAPASSAAPSNTASLDHLLDPLRAVARAAGPVRMEWYRSQTRVLDEKGSCLYADPQDLNRGTSKKPRWARMRFTGGEAAYPVRFRHAAGVPGVWLKLN